MLSRLAIVAAVALGVWAVAWALRRYRDHATTPQRFDPADAGDAGASAMLVTFSGPWCLECEEIRPRLQAAAAEHRVPLTVIDIKASPDLAAKYDVRLTPTTFVVGTGGTVRAGWLGTPPDGEIEAALAAVRV